MLKNSKFTIFGEPVISLLARSIGDVKYMKLKSSNSLSINICNLQTKCRFFHQNINQLILACLLQYLSRLAP